MKIAVLALLVLGGTTRGMCADSAAILERVAAAYDQIVDYQVDVETTVISSEVDAPATKSRYLIAASKPKQLFSDERVLSPIRYEIMLGTDGETAWGYSPSSKKYVIDSVDGENTEEAKALREQHFRLFRKFEILDHADLIVDVIGWKTCSDGKRNASCIVLHLTPREGEHWEEKLWVHASRFLVMKSVFRKTTPFETLTTVTLWRNMQVNVPIKQTRFQFVPPPNASRTNALQIP
ncbi:MAG: hypothetical protein M3Z23_10490 [Acidobacteriota bacterium]|nr:hypothetical protein [Acidobacteriota bacterium]